MSEYAELLMRADIHGTGILDRSLREQLIADLAAAIRALEAEVEEVRNSRDDCMRCDRLAGEVERLKADVLRQMAWKTEAQDELEDICNELPGVAFMDPPDGGSVSIAEQVKRMYAALQSQDAEVARLTSELAAARENEARWLWMFPDDPLISVTERMQRVYRKWDGSDSWNDAVDAARRAGEGEQ